MISIKVENTGFIYEYLGGLAVLHETDKTKDNYLSDLVVRRALDRLIRACRVSTVIVGKKAVDPRLDTDF